MDGKVKISFRSKGKFDVNQFARTYFSGGGHINAAGGKSDLSLNDTIDKFLEIDQRVRKVCPSALVDGISVTGQRLAHQKLTCNF